MTAKSKTHKPPVQFTVLGGLGEIGMNCMVLECEDELLLIDCGLLFSDLETFGIEYIIPNLKALLDKKDKLKAFLVTHGHEDHIGAIPYAVRMGFRAPVIATPFTCALVKDRLTEFGQLSRVDIQEVKYGGEVEFKHFKVKYVPVNHSIVEACALLIDTPQGRIIHTGDFKMDPFPFYGHPMDLKEFKAAGKSGVRLLLSDSTNIEVKDHSVSERNVYEKFEEAFLKAQGLIVVSMFASNVARIGQVVEIARRQRKKVALAGRSMESNFNAARTLGYLDGAESCFINVEEIEKHERSKVIVLSTGSQGEFRSALTRIANGEHKQIILQKGDLVVLSSKFIPGNEVAISRVLNQLFRQGADVMYEAMHDVHASGHASEPELRKMIEAVQPEYFVPVHGEYRHLVHHAALAREAGVKESNAQVMSNGDIFELDRDGLKRTGVFEAAKVLIEGEFHEELQRELLRERRRLGERGVAFVMLTRNSENGKIIAGPEVVFKGLVPLDAETKFKEQTIRAVKDALRETQSTRGRVPTNSEAAEEVRLAVQRIVKATFNRKPGVVPLVIDL